MSALVTPPVTELRTSPKNTPRKARKPQARSLPLRQAIAVVALEYERMSVRQLFYQLVARGKIEKTEHAYKRVCDVSVQMRLDGSLSYRKITDGHRTRRVVEAYGGLRDVMVSAHQYYRRNYWLDQPLHVEVWCEKDALSGVICPVCDEFGIPYVATRGFPSVTLLYESAAALKAIGKPANIYYLGDHDASGHSISANLEPCLRGFGADVRVHRVALNPLDVAVYRLPTRPGKWSDSRHAAFAQAYGDACVELDALPPDILTGLIRSYIDSNIDADAWGRAAEIERLEDQTLASLAAIDWQPGITYSLNGDGA